VPSIGSLSPDTLHKSSHVRSVPPTVAQTNQKVNTSVEAGCPPQHLSAEYRSESQTSLRFEEREWCTRTDNKNPDQRGSRHDVPKDALNAGCEVRSSHLRLFHRKAPSEPTTDLHRRCSADGRISPARQSSAEQFKLKAHQVMHNTATIVKNRNTRDSPTKTLQGPNGSPAPTVWPEELSGNRIRGTLARFHWPATCQPGSPQPSGSPVSSVKEKRRAMIICPLIKVVEISAESHNTPQPVLCSLPKLSPSFVSSKPSCAVSSGLFRQEHRPESVAEKIHMPHTADAKRTAIVPEKEGFRKRISDYNHEARHSFHANKVHIRRINCRIEGVKVVNIQRPAAIVTTHELVHEH
jgi:hypothetical protein